jgi:aminoglycoside phosphotransferase family enzyme/predicted kinase
VAFLSRPGTYGATGPVARLDTHISHLFLVGDRAYKLKRAVRFPYLDFSTPALRRRTCRAEIAVNRRTAPDLYLGVMPVLRDADGSLALGALGEGDGDTDAVDWLVVMQRFDQDDLFDAMAQRGALDAKMIVRLADVIATFHEDARPTPGFGGGEGIGRVITGNAEQMGGAAPSVFDPASVDRLATESRQSLERVGALLDERRGDGRVRHCHGDLHLGNVCLWRGEPTPFDAIEFNDRIANIDVLYDFAFLLMDMEHRGLRALANAALNRYLSRAADYAALAALPLLLSCRAGVRAQVTASRAAAAQAAGEFATARAAEDEARSYLALAHGLLMPGEARLVAVGGLSGTGKSVLAKAIAPGLGAAPGAVVLRSDVIRKVLLGVDPLTRLAPDAYGAAVTQSVYETMRAQAEAALAGGHSVVADAVHAGPQQRAALAAMARRLGVPFDGLWLKAPPAARFARIRNRAGDESDATVQVARAQSDYTIGTMDWTPIPAGGAAARTLAAGQKALNLTPKHRTL